MTKHSSVSRRQFLATSAATATALACPAVVTASKTTPPPIVGEGDYQYEVQHNWPQLPEKFQWQTTHNVAVDSDNCLYVIHEGRTAQTEHPAIFVFDPEGRYMRSFGNQFQGGGHGIEVRKEGNEQFIYTCAYQEKKTFAKLNLQGETVWQKFAPMESGVYAEGEDTDPKKVWGQNRFLPTNFAFLNDGGFLLADGYGSYYIHRYDAQGKWLSCFGGPGEGKGKFKTPHGIWIDRRPGRTEAVVVCDRAHNTLQYLTLEGEHLETLTGYGLPANIDTWKDLMLVPELHARVTLLNAENKVVARLGDDVQRITSQKGIRNDSKLWNDGRFVHPHDACFDADGNIFVAEWVATGRVSKLTRVS